MRHRDRRFFYNDEPTPRRRTARRRRFTRSRRRFAELTAGQRRTLESCQKKAESAAEALHDLLTSTNYESKDADSALDNLEAAAGYLERAIKHPG